MKTMHTRRLIAAVLAAALLLALAAPVLAASTTMVATANVYVRSGPGKQYKVLTTLYKGKTIVKTGTSGQWAKVTYNGASAYIMGSYLKAYTAATPKPAATPTPTPTLAPVSVTLYAVVSTAIRSGPGLTYGAIGYLDPGQSITPTGAAEAGYYPVQLGSRTGYVAVSDVGAQNIVSGSVYATTVTPVYSGTATTTTVIGYLSAGQAATRSGSVGSLWTQIVYNGQTGYVLTSQVTTTGAGTAGSVYAASSTVPIYSSTAASSILGYLSQGQGATSMGTTGIWTQIVYNGQTGYVLTSQVTATGGGSAAGTVYAASSTVPVYSSTAASSVLGYLSQGQGATSMGTTGIWTQIVYNGQAGYVLTSQVTAGGGTAAGFTALNRTMYALSGNVSCYSQPYAQSTYYVGYLSINESVWAISTNGAWVQAYVQGQTQALYIQAGNLGYTTGGTSVTAGTTLYVQLYTGAATYADTNGTSFTYTYKPAGSTVLETVASIDRGAAVKVISSYGDWVYVSWAGRDGVTRNAYVMTNKLGATNPA